MKAQLSHERLCEVLEYDRETGFFYWKENTGLKVVPRALAGRKSLDGHEYSTITIDDTQYRAHRLAWYYVNGEWPNGVIDHINHNKVDNRIENLRDVDPVDNSRNQPLRKDSKSGCLGVYFDKSCGKWFASFTVNGSNKLLGYYEEKDKAILARKKFEKENGYHVNHGKPRTVKSLQPKFYILPGLTLDSRYNTWRTEVDGIYIGMFKDHFEAVCAHRSYALDGTWRSLVEAKEPKPERNRLPGVSWSSKRKRWVVSFLNKKKNIFIGHFDDHFDAVCALKSYEIGSSYKTLVDDKLRKLKGIFYDNTYRHWTAKYKERFIANFDNYFDAACAVKSYEVKSCWWAIVQDRLKMKRMKGLQYRKDRKMWLAIIKRTNLGQFIECWDAICAIKSHEVKSLAL